MVDSIETIEEDVGYICDPGVEDCGDTVDDHLDSAPETFPQSIEEVIQVANTTSLVWLTVIYWG